MQIPEKYLKRPLSKKELIGKDCMTCGYKMSSRKNSSGYCAFEMGPLYHQRVDSTTVCGDYERSNC